MRILTAAAIVLSIILAIAEVSNANTWISRQTGISVTVPDSIREITQMGFTSKKEKPYIERTYSFFTTSDNQLVYICEVSLKRGSWPKPSPKYDPIFGRKQNSNHKALLRYEPHRFAVWKALNPVAIKAIQEAGLRKGFVDDCIFVTKCKLNKKRNVGLWIAISYRVGKNITDKDINEAVREFDKHIIID